MASAESISVEVAYALPDRQLVLKLEVPAEASLEQAIHASGILEQFPEIDLGKVMKKGAAAAGDE